MSWKDGSSRHAEDEAPASPKSPHTSDNVTIVVDNTSSASAEEKRGRSSSTSKQRAPSVSTIASLPKSVSPSPPRKRHTARSGSISENVVEANGVRKIVLETTSSSDSEDKALLIKTDGAQDQKENARSNTDTDGTQNDSQGAGNSKKKRKKRGKKAKKGGWKGNGEDQPLLGGGS